MTKGEVPFRSFTMRSEGYDRNEVDVYIEDQQNEIARLRRVVEAATYTVDGEMQLSGPEGEDNQTLGLSHETAERVLPMAQLAHARSVRDDLRTEAAELKVLLERYRSQASEAADFLAAATAGALKSLGLPELIDDDVATAGTLVNMSGDTNGSDVLDSDNIESRSVADATGDGSFLRAVKDLDDATENDGDALADVISIEMDLSDSHAQVDAEEGTFGGTFLAEVRAAADEADVSLVPESVESDLFLSELRGIADGAPDDLDSDAADRFFDDGI
jgi:hypothetical protein